MAYEGFPEQFAPAEVEVDEVGRIILKARELLSDPAKWCKGSPRKGDRFCIIGAVYKCVGGYDQPFDGYPEGYNRAIDRLAKTIRSNGVGPSVVTSFNDSHSHADVLALLDRAAKAGDAQ